MTTDDDRMERIRKLCPDLWRMADDLDEPDPSDDDEPETAPMHGFRNLKKWPNPPC